MQFIGTRTGAAGVTGAAGATGAVSASGAILRGLAERGGLYVPESFPSFDLAQIDALRGMTYAQRAVEVLSAFLQDFTREELACAVNAAYSGFDDARVAPLCPAGTGTYALELYHGPTLAFKDMALQLLPHLMTLSMQKHGETREVLILVATSGDTGKAALEGFADVPGTRCAVFYPQSGVSEAQRLQMVTQRGENTHVIAVRGNFDDAQTGVKRIFADAAFAKKMDAQGRALSSANSINFGRLVPQIVYYFSAYADLLSAGTIAPGDPVNFCVPTGNFGNILAAEYARRSGLPVARLICASNGNNVLTDFIETGCYDIDGRAFYKSLSPSMDILISSNLERLLFELCDRDAAQVGDWMEALKAGKRYDIGHERLRALREVFAGGFTDDAGTLAEIRRAYEAEGYLMDPHTAVASHVLRAYRARTGDKRPAVLVSTASPYKFGRSVLSAIAGQRAAEGRDDFACCRLLAERTGTRVPEAIAELPSLPIRHDRVCDTGEMEAALLSALACEGHDA